MDKEEAKEKVEQAGFTLEKETEISSVFVKESKPNYRYYFGKQCLKVTFVLYYDTNEDGSVYVESVDWWLDVNDNISLDDGEVGDLIDLLTTAQNECQELESDIV